MPNTFGKLFTLTTWGESHGPAVGVVIDGCPPRLPLEAAEIQAELDRRRPGQSDIVTPRKEEDRVEILSGVFEGKTTGTPISLLVRNADQRPGAYDEMRDKFRPSHADYTYQAKFGIRDHRGGGRSSARETIGRVAAGAIAKKLLALGGSRGGPGGGIEIRAFLTQVHDIVAPAVTEFPTLAEVEATAVRCPHLPTAEKMIERIKAVRSEGDSVGGVIECRVRGVPAGWGEPVFDRLEADLAKAMLSLPATKGFEIGSGFAGARLRAQRCVRVARRPRAHGHEPQRRDAGRHQQRRGDRVPRRVQADGHDPAVAADRGRARRADGADGPRAARPLCGAAGGADCGGDDGARAGRSRDAPARAGGRVYVLRDDPKIPESILRLRAHRALTQWSQRSDDHGPGAQSRPYAGDDTNRSQLERFDSSLRLPRER
jgi:chorismate synthase